MSDQLAQYFGASEGGALVTSVEQGSAAEKAGLKAGDVITSINGGRVRDAEQVVDAHPRSRRRRCHHRLPAGQEGGDGKSHDRAACCIESERTVEARRPVRPARVHAAGLSGSAADCSIGVGVLRRFAAAAGCREQARELSGDDARQRGRAIGCRSRAALRPPALHWRRTPTASAPPLRPALALAGAVPAAAWCGTPRPSGCRSSTAMAPFGQARARRSHETRPAAVPVPLGRRRPHHHATGTHQPCGPFEQRAQFGGLPTRARYPHRVGQGLPAGRLGATSATGGTGAGGGRCHRCGRCHGRPLAPDRSRFGGGEGVMSRS